MNCWSPEAEPDVWSSDHISDINVCLSLCSGCISPQARWLRMVTMLLHRTGLFPILINVICILVQRTFALRTVEQLFDVSYDQNVGGNCAAIGSARLNAMLGDAADLANAGVTMVVAANDANNPLYPEARRMLDAWFESPFLTADQYDRVGRKYNLLASVDVTITKLLVWYQAVTDWLNGALTTTDAGRSSVKPLLVCGENSFGTFQPGTIAC